MRATVTYRGTGRPGEDNRYELRTPHAPSRDTLVEAQIAAGFHPAGYGGPYDVSSREDNGEILTTWTSSSSCD